MNVNQQELNKSQLPFVDQWVPDQNQIIFTTSKNMIICNLASYFHLEETENSSFINCFMTNTKKSYNSPDLRLHYCQYMNYFEAYYDTDFEYFTNIANIKFCIDCYNEYKEQQFILDIKRYILNDSIIAKTNQMVEDNYNLKLSYKSLNSPQLQYTDAHAKILMHASILMNMAIPLITHFSYMRRLKNVDEFLLDIYDLILYHPYFESVDIVSKLFQTTKSNVDKNAKNNAPIWSSTKQDIRGKDTVTHAEFSIRNIILNIMPKYIFSHSMINLNYTSIVKNNRFQVTDIAYEFTYIPLSSAAGEGEDSSSELDRYEATLIKTNEAIFLQSQINCKLTIDKVIKLWGPFDKAELDFYYNELKNSNGEIMNGFQKQMIFNLFYKYFGDTESINSINYYDYISLMLAARKMLKRNMMTYLPYIISSKITKITSRKTLNKKELVKMQQSQYFHLIEEKYKNEKIYKQILGLIATIITSDFKIIDYNKDNTKPTVGCNGSYVLHAGELNAKPIKIEPDILIEEALLYILLI